MLETVWLLLLILHIIPLALYIAYMKRIANNKPWNVKIDPNFEPMLSVIIPTYMESAVIRRKLDNTLEADYPKNKMEILIIDSASPDETINTAQRWAEKHPEVKVKLIREKERRGMVKALNYGLKHADGQIIVKTDADCLWPKDSLRNAVKYLADPMVGSVAGLGIIQACKENVAVKVEKTYRRLYRWIRIGESKLFGTVLYEGELMLMKRKLLEATGGFDEEIGADDISIALRMAEHGYRAITVEDAYYVELTPYAWRTKFRQKVRRARHLLQAMWKYKYLILKGGGVVNSLFLPMEIFIYIVAPLLAVPLMISSLALIVKYPWLLLFSLALAEKGVQELAFTNLTNTAIMLLAIMRELTGREHLVWTKIEEIR